ncbi:MAG: holo-ACP synthase [Spirochaetes bacterium]|nr:holo-ACP synthase [Spirochaetota bacterium]
MDRVRKIEKKYRKAFLEKFLSPEEIILSEKKDFYPFIAGRFAAKEAIQKAVSLKLLNPAEITILNDENGKPFLDNLPDFLKKNSLPASARILISISHEKKYAAAMVIIEN